MEVVDVILSVTTAFFIIILFSTLTYEQGTLTFKIDQYENKIQSADRAFEALLSPGLPEYWYVDPESASYFGLLQENYGYELDTTKVSNLSSLCNSDEDLVKEKLFIPSDYHVYIYIHNIFSSNSASICSPPSSQSNEFIRETYVVYNGEMASMTMVMWK